MRDGSIDEAPIWSDLRTFDGHPWRSCALVIGGVPCQSASLAGKRRGTSDSRWLWDDAVRVVKEVQPQACFFENVPGLVSGKLLNSFRERIVGGLEELGYRVASGLFTAQEVGASHKRERLFILADSGGFYRERRRKFGELGEVQERKRNGHPPDDSGAPLGHPESGFGHVSGNLEGTRGNLEAPEEPGAKYHVESGGPGGSLGDPRVSRLEGRGCERIPGEAIGPLGERRERNLPEGPGAFDFIWRSPPGPLSEHWGEIIRDYPWLAPAIKPGVRLFSNGTPYVLVDELRIDQLRALGNAVFPLQAAYAYSELARVLAGATADIAVAAPIG